MLHRALWGVALLAALAISGCSNTPGGGSKTAETTKTTKAAGEPSLSERLGIDPTMPASQQFDILKKNAQQELASLKPNTLERAKASSEYTQLAMAIANEHPSDPAAPQILAWVVSFNGPNARGMKAIDIIKEKYLDNPGIGPAVGPQLGKETLEMLLEKSPSDEIKGLAVLALLQVNSAPKPNEDELQKLADLINEKYADIHIGSKTLADAAKPFLAALRLRVGKTAPDIIGQDTDGVDFKLTDYRGKVVMLDFWGQW